LRTTVYPIKSNHKFLLKDRLAPQFFIMKTQAFEIRIALLGYVSAGKSTVLNALLQGKFSQTAMRRTTAGVNCFRIYTKGDKDSEQVSSSKEPEWNPDPDVVHTSEQTLHQITADNERLRAQSKVQESTFNVELDKPICRMRKDTTLVLIDIPGLNEAGSKDMYRDYVNTKWDTFDCAIVVMDVFQGVNTEEQVQLLKIVNSNLLNKKDIPTIVLCNKVDDPDNKEVKGFVKEIKKTVRGYSARAHAEFIPLSAENAFVYRTASRLSREAFQQLDESLVDKIGTEEIGKAKWRKLNMKERYATAYEAVSNRANIEASIEATNFGVFIETLNRCIGEQAQASLIRKQLEVCVKGLNFEKVVAEELKKVYNIHKVLGLPVEDCKCYFWNVYTVCSTKCMDDFKVHMDLQSLHGAMLQLVAYAGFLQGVYLLDAEVGEHSKIALAMWKLVSHQISCVVNFAESSEWSKKQGSAGEPIYDWNVSQQRWEEVFFSSRHYSHYSHFESNSAYGPKKGQATKMPLKDSPHHWMRTEKGWKHVSTGRTTTGEYNPVSGKPVWDTLSPFDFCTMCESILVLSSSKLFCTVFGRQKVSLERVVTTYHCTTNYLDKRRNEHGYETSDDDNRLRMMLCEWTKGTYTGDYKFEPKYPDKYQIVAHVEMPEMLSDPNHWGHLAWQLCEFIDSSSEWVSVREVMNVVSLAKLN
jgi:small GTP-binding protein